MLRQNIVIQTENEFSAQNHSFKLQKYKNAKMESAADRFLVKKFSTFVGFCKKVTKNRKQFSELFFFFLLQSLFERKKLFDTGAVISRGQLESKTKLLKELPLLGVERKCKVSA